MVIITNPVLSRMYEQTLMCGKFKGVFYNAHTGEEFSLPFGEHIVSVQWAASLGVRTSPNVAGASPVPVKKQAGVVVKIPEEMLLYEPNVRRHGAQDYLWGISNDLTVSMTRYKKHFLIYLDPDDADRSCYKLAHILNQCLMIHNEALFQD